MENVAAERVVPRWAVIAIVLAWCALVSATHYGARSPYSYGWAVLGNEPENAAHFAGAVVNPDMFPMHEITLYFYEGRWVHWPTAQNMRLPLHSFVTSIVLAFTRGTLLANYLVNFVFAALLTVAAVKMADRFGIRRAATLVTLLTFFSLPLYVDYAGQPLHYIVATVATFLVMLSAISVEKLTPWVAGLAAAILTLSYDPYVFLAAFLAYLVFVRRFPRKRDWVIFVLVGAIPNILWSQYLRFSSEGEMSRHLRQTFIEPVLQGWREMLRDPIGNALQPFVASHIGVHVAVHQIVAMIYWPLVVACLWLLVRLRPRISTRFELLPLLPLFLFLEQMAAAAWDWELNPRRAIPVMLAFAVAWCFATNAVWRERRWRIGIVALTAMSLFLAMSDVILGDPVMAFLRTGQAVRYAPHEAIRHENLELNRQSMPKLMRDERIDWRDVGAAKLETLRVRKRAFAAGQAVGLFLLLGVCWLCGRGGLLPRWSWLAALGVWAASLVRFV